MFMLLSFEDKSGCRILCLLECQEDVLKNLIEEENYSSLVLTEQRHRGWFSEHQQ